MRRIRIQNRYVCAAVVLAAIVLDARAQAQMVTVHLDPAQSEVHWTLSDTTHTVKGTFKLKGGLVSFDPKTGAANGELLVDVETGESGNHTRDDKMKKEVLESKKYPAAFFHPTRITGALKPGTTQDLTAEGTFNIHGADHPLTVKLAVQLDGTAIVARTHFVVPYVAWGMKDPSFLVFRVGKQVDMDVIARGTVEGSQ